MRVVRIETVIGVTSDGEVLTSECWLRASEVLYLGGVVRASASGPDHHLFDVAMSSGTQFSFGWRCPDGEARCREAHDRLLVAMGVFPRDAPLPAEPAPEPLAARPLI